MRARIAAFSAWLPVALCFRCPAADPLPSWNNTAPKQAVLAFVGKVTTPGSPDFVAAPERIAVFDNDGTLWSEQPLYFQLLFAMDRIKALAAQHPKWKEKEPFASVLRGNIKAALASGEHALEEIVMATHAGLTTEEFEETVTHWITTARHPVTGLPFTGMVFQPMLELLDYLRAHQFKPFIVSGGGIEFMRPWAGKIYGIPPEQVVGSSGGLKYEVRDGKPVIVKLSTIVLNDDKAGKPVGIQRHIGRRPLAAFGNSDGDFEMLEWTTSGSGLRFGLLVHHDDAEREWAYDRASPVGGLARGLDEGPRRGWTILSMRADWNTIHPGKQPPHPAGNQPAGQPAPEPPAGRQTGN